MNPHYCLLNSSQRLSEDNIRKPGNHIVNAREAVSVFVARHLLLVQLPAWRWQIWRSVFELTAGAERGFDSRLFQPCPQGIGHPGLRLPKLQHLH